MILVQTKALFADAYRELNARKLFWVTMALSVLVALSLALMGIDEEGVTMLWFRVGFLPLNSNILEPKAFYLGLFSVLGIGIWLTWAATILALISTANIIPDLISGGVIETLLSKPISRSRLLLTKFSTGLLFVAMQVGVFSLLSIAIIGVRGGYWEPRILLAVPIVVVFYSYLFSVCVLIGLITRSTMAAILLTALLWSALAAVNAGDAMLVRFQESTRLYIKEREARIELAELNTIKLIRRDLAASGNPDETYAPTHDETAEKNPFLNGMREGLDDDTEDLRTLNMWQGIVFSVKTILPKTGETIGLLNRVLIDPEAFRPNDDNNGEMLLEEEIEIDQNELSTRVEDRFRARSIWWVLGTSLLFESFILGVSILIFARRDF